MRETGSGSSPMAPCVRLPPWVHMTIITWMGAGVSAYLQAPDDWWDLVLRTQRCPHCLCLCRRHSVRERAAWTQFLLRVCERIPVLRIYCPQCGATFTILPDFLTPRHRYQVAVREAVVTGAEPAPVCCAQTVTRWRRAFVATVSTAIHHLRAWLLTDMLALGRQDQRFLRGEMRGVNGLKELCGLAIKCGRPSDTSGLFGWINREFGQQAFVL